MPPQGTIHWFDPRTWPWYLYLIVGSMLYGWMKPLWKWFQRKRALNWPSIQGRVQTTASKRKLWGEGEEPIYLAKISYVYTVNGQEYTNQHREEFASEEKAIEFLRDLQGKSVMVSFNPQKPSTSLVMPTALKDLLEMRAPVNAVNENYKVLPSWTKLLLWPLAALAALGFAASLWINLRAVFSRIVADESWLLLLSVGVFVVFFPTVFIVHRYGKAEAKNDWKAWWKDAPPWVKYVANGLSLYTMVNIFVALTQAPGDHAGMTSAGWRISSVVWMDIYYAALVVLYPAARDASSYNVNTINSKI